ncbi:hypothetical protein AKJ09_03520 [Labilithrix luteola]|uniref:Uncharacterized protein n=1 Tax=Labilithrix luteola TaxID=1391654 RepID=A0A0K1PU18_9BACT|nr:hypothetical protein AKJ09_03520 [Labilithrix luteola]
MNHGSVSLDPVLQGSPSARDHHAAAFRRGGRCFSMLPHARCSFGLAGCRVVSPGQQMFAPNTAPRSPS